MPPLFSPICPMLSGWMVARGIGNNLLGWAGTWAEFSRFNVGINRCWKQWRKMRANSNGGRAGSFYSAEHASGVVSGLEGRKVLVVIWLAQLKNCWSMKLRKQFNDGWMESNWIELPFADWLRKNDNAAKIIRSGKSASRKSVKIYFMLLHGHGNKISI